jgi:hypothetical protein
MADRDKPRGIAVMRVDVRGTIAPDVPTRLEGVQREQSRTEKELEPIAIRVAENAALMQRFRAACGSEIRTWRGKSPWQSRGTLKNWIRRSLSTKARRSL